MTILLWLKWRTVSNLDTGFRPADLLPASRLDTALRVIKFNCPRSPSRVTAALDYWSKLKLTKLMRKSASTSILSITKSTMPYAKQSLKNFLQKWNQNQRNMSFPT
ncbi:hypothetical protein AAHE18_20G211300 [Arachis hypogaea]